MVIKLRKTVSVAFLSILFLLATYPYAPAQDKKAELKVYQKFFQVTGTEAQYNQILDIMVVQMQQTFSATLKELNKKIGDATPEEKARIRQLIEQAMGKALKRMRVKTTEIMPLNELINNVYYPVYSRYFTISEIEELIAFYESPIGHKFISTTPALMQESVVIINQKYTPRLQEIGFKIGEEEMEKIRPEIEKLRKNN